MSAPDPNIVARYKEVYFHCFDKLNSDMRARVLKVQADLTIRDRLVEEFVKNVIALAESDFKVPAPVKKV